MDGWWQNTNIMFTLTDTMVESLPQSSLVFSQTLDRGKLCCSRGSESLTHHG